MRLSKGYEMKLLLVLFFSLNVFAQTPTPTPDCYDHPVGNTMVGTNSGSLTPDRKRVTAFEMFEPGWIVSVFAFIQPGSDNQPVRGLVYSDNGTGWPLKLLGTSKEVVIQGSSPRGWVRMDLMLPIEITQPTKLWIGLLSGPSLSPAQIKFTCGGKRTISFNPYQAGPSAEFGPIDTSLDGAMNVYAIYQHQAPAVCPNGACVIARWTEVPQQGSFPIIGYRIYYGRQPGWYEFNKEIDYGTTQTMIDGLDQGSQYCFAIKSYNSQNQESPFSNEICTMTNVDDPVSVNFQ